MHTGTGGCCWLYSHFYNQSRAHVFTQPTKPFAGSFRSFVVVKSYEQLGYNILELAFGATVVNEITIPLSQSMVRYLTSL